MKQEVWMTYIASNDDVQQALRLGRSLRFVQTKKPIFTLLSASLDDEQLLAVNDVFDGSIILPFNDLKRLNRQNLDAFAKAYCWSLDLFEIICFLESTSIVLQNCDNLFSLCTSKKPYYLSEDGSCFLIQPSKKRFFNVFRKMNQDGTDDAKNNDLKNFITNLYTVQKLPTTLYEVLDNNSIQFWNLDSTAIVNIKLDEADNKRRTSTTEKKLQQLIKKLEDNFERPIQVQNNFQQDKEDIAIIGMACRLPGCNNPDEFWSLLITKGNAIRAIGSDRWTPEQSCFVDSCSLEREVGFLKCPVDKFDSQFFEMSPAELIYTDPQQRLLLEVVWEALEDAVIDPLSVYNCNVGVFTGLHASDYRDLLIESGFKGSEFFRTFMGNSFGVSSARISHFLGTTGPNIAVESGCSGSLISMNAACDSLRKGESKLALCCGSNLILHPYRYEDMKSLLAKDNRCKTFDENADGFVRGEGVACLVLKRLTDAERDKDRVLGVIKGIGIAHEGTSKSIGTPTVHCESLAMTLALQNAKLSPNEVSYIEAHGTGTAVGDPIEIKAIEKAYKSPISRAEPLFIGSVKTNIGHTEACSGIASVIKVLKSFEHQVIPPHINLKRVNPSIDLSSIPAKIPTEERYWPKYCNGIPRTAGVSNFGISGTDCHIILQEPPLPKLQMNNSLPQVYPEYNIVTVSAKTKLALEKLISLYANNISATTNLADVAFSLNTGRAHFKFRSAFVAKNVSHLQKQLRCYSLEILKSSKTGSKICFAFTGQGSHCLGMGKELYSTFPAYKVAFDRCSVFLNERYGLKIKDVIWGDSDAMFRVPSNCQAAIFVVQYSITELLKSLNIVPDIVVGHNFGEFCAAVVAGCLSVEDALFIIMTKGKLSEELEPGEMMAVCGKHDDLVKLNEKFEQDTSMWLDIAAKNSETQTVVSGNPAAIKEFQVYCQQMGYDTYVVNSKYAYNSREFDSISPKLYELVKKLPLKKPEITFISSYTGKTLESDLTGDYWCDQMRSPVQFSKVCEELKKQNVNVFLEIGPTPVLVNLFKSNIIQEDLHNYTITFTQKQGASQFRSFLDSLSSLYSAGLNINWKMFHQMHPWKKISLPHYPFLKQSFWFPRTEKNISQIVHPLLGLPKNATTPCRLYQQDFDLQKLPWIRDHSLFETVVFPGAGFIEMGLSISRKFGNKYPTLRKISFNLAMSLKEKTSYEIQTICSEDQQVLINTREYNSGQSKWVNNASMLLEEVKEINATTHPRKLLDVKDEIRSAVITDIYSVLYQSGYHFKKRFQTITRILKGKNDYLAEVHFNLNLNDWDSYMLHPLVIDSVMQVMIFVKHSPVDKVKLPVQVDKFVLFKSQQLNKGFVHIYGEHLSKGTLYNENGEVLLILEGLESTAVSKDTLCKILNIQNISLHPPIFRNEWVETTQIPFSFKNPYINSSIIQQFKQAAVKVPKLDSIDYNMLEKTVGLGILKSFIELGFKKLESTNFNSADVISALNIKIHMHSFLLIRRLLEILVEDEWLKREDETQDVLKFCKPLPTFEELSDQIDNNVVMYGTGLQMEWEFSLKFLSEMSNILLEKTSALKLLFPDYECNFSAEKFYEKAEFFLEGNAVLESAAEKIICDRYFQTGKVLRIIEIGAGTGSATKKIIPILKRHNINFEYMFTDISSAFFIKAEKTFKDYITSFRFQVLNIEQDIAAQGFAPYYYDICIASNVLHATQDLTISIFNARQLLKPYGHLIIFETFIPQRHFDITVGHLEGYWLFQDFDLRKNHCVVNSKQWERLLSFNGFREVFSIPVFYGGGGVVVGETGQQSITVIPDNSAIWILIGDPKDSQIKAYAESLNSLKRFAAIISYDSDEVQFVNFFQEKALLHRIEGVMYYRNFQRAAVCTTISLKYLEFLKAVLKCGVMEKTKLLLLMEGVSFLKSKENHFSPAGGELLGLTKVFQTENPSMQVKILDLEQTDLLEEKVQKLLQETFTKFLDLCVTYRSHIRYISKLVKEDYSYGYPSLVVPQQDSFILDMPTSGIISDLKFVPNQRIPPRGTFVEIRVASIALNFLDIFLVFQSFKKSQVSQGFGADIAGIVVALGENVTRFKIGDSVFGGRMQPTPISSYVNINEKELIPMPPFMTYEQASTFPIAFATAYYCLVTLGKLKTGENILIHTASGGVGLFAVQIAKKKGAVIFATAGNTRKRAYLKSLGIQHVYDSRSLGFSEQILRITDGNGVNLVINSLTSEGYKETTLDCVAKNGRFIEMSKFNIWSSQEIKQLRDDVFYEVVDLSDYQATRWQNLMAALKAEVWSNKLQPVPYKRFDICDVREAIATLQKATHIGKIVCSFPNTEASGIFNSRSTYLVTGGLKGVGLCVAEWMSSFGAKYFVLIGKSPPTNNCLSIIKQMESRGASVKVFEADVGSMMELKSVFEQIRQANSFPPIRGIMHAAGSLADAPILEQNEKKFLCCLNPKMIGSWNLHLLTRDTNLEHFVNFSSFAAVLGSPGQSNHAASNTFLDQLAFYRHSIGLPCLSINWGQWGETGIVAGQKIHGYTSFTNNAALLALKKLLMANAVNAAVVDGDVNTWKSLFPWSKSYLSSICQTNSYGTDKTSLLTKDNDYLKLDTADVSPQDQLDFIKSKVRDIVGTILQMPLEVDDESDLAELHLDSLMIIELRSLLQNFFCKDQIISSNNLSDFSSVSTISDQLYQLLVSTRKDTNNSPSPALLQLIKSDCVLWKDTALNKSTLSITPSMQIETVLLTGATGNLGPYLLNLLSNRPHIKKIYCLVRPTKTISSQTKLVLNLTQLEIVESTQMHKIVAINGDICQTFLGIDEPEYFSLCKEVDAVFHCAAYTNHLESYQSLNISQISKMRQVNVIGTQRILKFASELKHKWVYYASSIVAVMHPDKQGTSFSEDWATANEMDDSPDFGYAISKYVAEKLTEQAVERGLACKVFRLPLIGGNSVTGLQKIVDNHFFLKYSYYLKERIMPDDDVPICILPVDTVAKLTLELFFNDFVPCDIYNVVNPRVISEQELPSLAKQFGFSVSVVTYSKFLEHLKNDTKRSSFKNVADFYTDVSKYVKLLELNKFISAWKQHPNDFFLSKKIMKYMPTILNHLDSPQKILTRDFKYAIEKSTVFK